MALAEVNATVVAAIVAAFASLIGLPIAFVPSSRRERLQWLRAERLRVGSELMLFTRDFTSELEEQMFALGRFVRGFIGCRGSAAPRPTTRIRLTLFAEV